MTYFTCCDQLKKGTHIVYSLYIVYLDILIESISRKHHDLKLNCITSRTGAVKTKNTHKIGVHYSHIINNIINIRTLSIRVSEVLSLKMRIPLHVTFLIKI